MPAPVTDLGTALLTGLTAAFVALLSALPAILGAAILLIAGWIISGAVAGLVAKALRAARLETASQRIGLSAFLRRMQVRTDAAGIVAGFVKWYARLLFILMAADLVHITAISTIVNEVLAFVPNLLVAGFMVGAFAWLAQLARNASLHALEAAGVANARPIALLAYVATFGFGVVAAATQIGVASTLIDIAFTGLIGALALAFGLAFGLGGRDEAARIWSDLRSQTATASVTPSVQPGAARVAPLETAPAPHNGRPHGEVAAGH